MTAAKQRIPVNLITGFVKPDEGKVLYRGKRISGLAPYKVAQRGVARTQRPASLEDFV